MTKSLMSVFQSVIAELDELQKEKIQQSLDAEEDMQFAVLAKLVGSKREVSGPELRDAIIGADATYNKTANFYHLMKRMESAGLVVGETGVHKESKRKYRVRFYKHTRAGRAKLKKETDRSASKATVGYFAMSPS